jgi:hypothetical protein
VILGYTSGRSLNTGFIANQSYWAGKMLEQYAAYRPFRELDDAIGIAQDDWWMTDDRGQKLSFMLERTVTESGAPDVFAKPERGTVRQNHHSCGARAHTARALR